VARRSSGIPRHVGLRSVRQSADVVEALNAMRLDSDSQDSRRHDEPAGIALRQRVARLVSAAALAALGLWILRPFIAALAWALIFAIAAWPLYERLNRMFAERRQPVLAPLAITVLIGLVFLLPFALLARELVRDAGIILAQFANWRHDGIPMPDWLPQLPGVGRTLAQWWMANLADPQSVQELLGRAFTRIPTETVRQFGSAIVHRIAIFGFTLLTLFFVFRHGVELGGQILALSDHVLGPNGERIGRRAIAAVHATVNGLVLVGLAEGVLLAAAYAAARLPHPASIGMLTGILAVIPFGSPVAFGAAALYLAGTGSRIAAICLFVFGVVVVFVADHVVRPFLIGGGARLPFLWVLLGILGGLESFGFLGLFLGPMTMAALMSLWRDFTQSVPAERSGPESPRNPLRPS
jgi:predicted PurR-regulated permease PerM